MLEEVPVGEECQRRKMEEIMCVSEGEIEE
jgi:hypothetical protein